MKCKKCGKPVVRDEAGKLVRACEHTDAPVIAECSAQLKGQAKVNPR